MEAEEDGSETEDDDTFEVEAIVKHRKKESTHSARALHSPAPSDAETYSLCRVAISNTSSNGRITATVTTPGDLNPISKTHVSTPRERASSSQCCDAARPETRGLFLSSLRSIH